MKAAARAKAERPLLASCTPMSAPAVGRHATGTYAETGKAVAWLAHLASDASRARARREAALVTEAHRVLDRMREREGRAQALYGCTLEQYLTIPHRARRQFHCALDGAQRRGIPFLMTYWEWWCVWRDSGCWPERGRYRDNYAMGRHGDEGPYAVGNVAIITVHENATAVYPNRMAKMERSSMRGPP